VVRARLERRSRSDLAALAEQLVALPDPASDPDRATAAVELLLLVDGEAERAAQLIAGLEARWSPGDLALWRFRLARAALTAREETSEAAWEEALAPCRALAATDPAVSAAALRLAASGWLARATPGPHGAGWLAPILQGRWVANAHLARRRRPALGEALAPALRWLDEADALEPGEGLAPLDGLAWAADRADRADRFDDATRALADLAARAAGDPGVAGALVARAGLLLDPAVTPGAPDGLGELARRRVPEPAPELPSLPHRDWSGRLLVEGARLRDLEGARLEPADLRVLEACGAATRAARCWVARGDLRSLLHAARLRDALPPSERVALAAALAAEGSEDELVLAAETARRQAEAARYHVLAGEADRRLIRLRLAASLPAPQAHRGEDEDSDPHSPANRLAAAEDLLADGRPDAAAAIATSLLRRAEGDVLRRLAEMTTRLLSLEEPSADLVVDTSRHIREWDATSAGLLEALARSPAAGYAVHADLIAIGRDISRADAHRIAALEAWLAIWAATATPPAVEDVEAIYPVDPLLLPVAAARLAGASDPVATAAELVTTHPPSEASPEEVADALLALATST